MPPKLKELLATLGEAIAANDGTKTADTMKAIEAFKADAETNGYGDTTELAAAVKQIRADLDALAEANRRIERAGLVRSGNGVHIPEGRAARLEMLRDRRAFLGDETAKRFGAFATHKLAALGVLAGVDIPKYVLEMGESVAKDMDPDTPTAGGNLITDEFRSELIRNVEAVAQVYTQMRRVPLATAGKTQLPKATGGLTAYATDAGDAITKSTVSVALASLTPSKWGILTGVPNEFFRTGRLLVDLGNWIALEMVYGFAKALDNAVINGDGTATYAGITGILQSTNIASVAAAAGHETVAALDADDVSNVIAGVTAGYAIADARWGFSLSTQRKLRGITDGNDRPLYDRGSNGEPDTIDGYPYTLSSLAPAASGITAAEKYGWFGDLRLSHMFGMLGDIEIARSEHVYFANDMTAVRGIIQCDCAEIDANAICTGKTAASAG